MESENIKIIFIGASAGGISALLKILSNLPQSWKIPIVIVLHIPAHAESRLVEVFQYYVPIPVKMAQDKEKIQSGVIYFADADYHLAVEKDERFSLSGEDPINFSRPSIDLLMTSGAEAFGSEVLGILLTGANNDGAEGMANIKLNKGYTIVQDPQDAEISIMPQAAIQYCMPNAILNLTEISSFVVNLEKT